VILLQQKIYISPINEDVHWSIAAVINDSGISAVEDESNSDPFDMKYPGILLLDSFQIHPKIEVRE
jgi:hypothetical protein